VHDKHHHANKPPDTRGLALGRSLTAPIATGI
jgi:hypothetical protein